MFDQTVSGLHCPTDIASLVRIEKRCWPDPWSPQEFALCHMRPEKMVKVVRCPASIAPVGFVVTMAHRNSIEILNLTVDPDHRREGVASTLIAYVASKLNRYQPRLLIYVSEKNLGCHLFLKDRGFRATQIIGDFYRGHPGETAYRFELEFDPPKQCVTKRARQRFKPILG